MSYCPPGCAAIVQHVAVHVHRIAHHVRHFAHTTGTVVKASAIVVCAACPAQSVDIPGIPPSALTPPPSVAYVPDCCGTPIGVFPPPFRYTPDTDLSPRSGVRFDFGSPVPVSEHEYEHERGMPEHSHLPHHMPPPEEIVPSLPKVTEPAGVLLMLSALVALLIWRRERC